MMMITILLSFGATNTSSAAIAFFFLFMLVFGRSRREEDALHETSICTDDDFV